MTVIYKGPERREFLRLDYVSPLAYKVCKQETITTLLKGYTADVSASGLRCKIKQKVNIDDIVWLSFDRATLNICEELENRVFIYQNGIIGKVVWVGPKSGDEYNIGACFIIREEKNVTNIYPKIHFLKDPDALAASESEIEEDEEDTQPEEPKDEKLDDEQQQE